MNKISTGEDATLETYRKIAITLFGKKSVSVKFLDRKIKESPNKEMEEVIMEESQMLSLLKQLHERSIQLLA